MISIRLTLPQVGYKRPLETEDLWHYDEARLTGVLTDKVAANIEKRRQRRDTGSLLLAALNETFFWQFWSAGIFKAFALTSTAHH
jgi:ATP-binding cassette, subfamily C (CFTR/MRP), member 1